MYTLSIKIKVLFAMPSTCPNCVGLSEELQIVRLVIESGYIPIAISSIDRKSGCWSTARDVVQIEAVLSIETQFHNSAHKNDKK